MSAPSAPARATFRKHERLTGRDLIADVVKNGRSINASPLRITGRVRPLDSVAPAQVAFAIPKRHVRHASDRNRIRRVLREAWRLDKEQWYRTLRAAGVQCAWLILYGSDQAPSLADARALLGGTMERWLKQHLAA